MHLAELPSADVLNSLMPSLGHDWTETCGSLSVMYYHAAQYTLEWEAVATRFAADDHTLLQPAEPCWLVPLLYIGNLLKQTIATKELELCGTSLSRPHQGWSCPPPRVAWRGCTRANGHVAATRRLGVTSGTGAATGALIASGAKEAAAEDKLT